ncbi:YbaY family lipoprotein [Caulobacter sp. 17J80-11]|uniref:YbaY family lipoprotein n=1 Tax=Caulobacter sp. 17J80-11 TaxID=2763502 RepID=UPI0016537D06|nr:YbaY family lipoprotein [Caulobacter sp. 17J80-11]MBC6983082.1 YbaY family lipoprotein [Caulobacter sp. 17J80-11]
MRRSALPALCAFLLAACASPEKPAPATASAVTGTVTYRERILLPPTSTLTVRLEDVSLADAPAKTLAEQTRVIGPTAPPYSFRLKYEPGWIEPNHTYAVRAEIHDPEGALRFTTTTRHAVLTQGAPSDVEIVLQAAR